MFHKVAPEVVFLKNQACFQSYRGAGYFYDGHFLRKLVIINNILMLSTIYVTPR